MGKIIEKHYQTQLYDGRMVDVIYFYDEDGHEIGYKGYSLNGDRFEFIRQLAEEDPNDMRLAHVTEWINGEKYYERHANKVIMDKMHPERTYPYYEKWNS